MAYSSDLRTRVLQFIENGGSKTEAAKRFNVGRTAIYRWLNAKDPLTPGKPGPRKPRLLDPTALAEHVKRHPDQTLKERARHFGVSPRLCCLWTQKTRLHAKKKTVGYKEQCPEKRAAYQEQLATAQASGKTLIYLDETGFTEQTFRSYGYAPRGQCVHGLIPSQKTRTTTLVVAQLNNKLIAPKLVSGSCNAQRFNTWLDEELSPHLDTNSVVIMDNARIHKTEQTQALIQACGASVLYLPPYSPDYNPVEHKFANIKKLRSYNADKPIDDIINMYR